MGFLRGEGADQIGSEDKSAHEDRHCDLRLQGCDLARDVVYTPGNLGFGEQDRRRRRHSPALAKRSSKWLAAAGGFDSRVENFANCPAFSVNTPGAKVQ